MSINDGPVKVDELRQWEAVLNEQIGNLRLQIQSKTREAEVLEEKLELVSKLLLLDTKPGQVDEPVRHLSTNHRVDASNMGGVEPRPVEDVVEEVLQVANEPMHISKIREELIERGASIPGRGDEANIIVRLRKQPDRFTRTARGTYALEKWGLPEMQTTPRKSSRMRRIKR